MTTPRLVLVRSVGLGAAIGLSTGGLLATPSWPVMSTFFGAVAGAALGALAGLALGVVVLVRPLLKPTTVADEATLPVAYIVAGTHGHPQQQRESLPQAGRVVRWIVSAGSAIGAVAGLVIGLATYLPTAAAAVVEGAILGGVAGLVIALPVGAVGLLARSR